MFTLLPREKFTRFSTLDNDSLMISSVCQPAVIAVWVFDLWVIFRLTNHAFYVLFTSVAEALQSFLAYVFPTVSYLYG